MSRAVLYARFSSEKHTDQSLEGQLRECNEFAERKGYTVVRM
jgi:DNA invertase Pin-like site-specific DNA recombinase